jgi:hypothetical protein
LDVLVDITCIGNNESFQIVYGSGAGTVSAPTTAQAYQFTTKTKSGPGGTLTNLTSSQPTVTVTAGAAAKLAIISVNSGVNPTAGIGFNVVVQSQDTFGNPSNVTAATGFSLSRVAGTGTLGGTLTGTIANGQSQATVAGVTYTKAESGVVIRATRTSGNTLTPGDSARSPSIRRLPASSRSPPSMAGRIREPEPISRLSSNPRTRTGILRT